MMQREEYLAGLAKRLRELRLSLGYERASGFANAIGYEPGHYFNIEMGGIIRTRALRRLVQAIEAAGHDAADYDGLLSLEAAQCAGRVAPRIRCPRLGRGEVRP